MKLALKRKAELMIYLNLMLSFVLIGLMLYLFVISPGLLVTFSSLIILFAVLTFIGYFTIVISIEKLYTSFLQAVSAIIKDMGQ